MIVRLLALALLLPLLFLAHDRIPLSNVPQQPGANPPRWSENSASWHRIVAGPLPGLWADQAILEIFNIYNVAKDKPSTERPQWWHLLSYQLHRALTLDPRFRDAYRLTEGLLAYEPGFSLDAVDILEHNARDAESGEYLLVASFLAHQDLHDDARAIRLASMAASKKDTSLLAAGFAARLIQRGKGCAAAIAFLQQRKRLLPEKYAGGIEKKIERLKQAPACNPEPAADDMPETQVIPPTGCAARHPSPEHPDNLPADAAAPHRQSSPHYPYNSAGRVAPA